MTTTSPPSLGGISYGAGLVGIGGGNGNGEEENDQVSWSPSSEQAQWEDMNGPGAGDLATFLATADLPTVTILNFSGQSITAITNINSTTLPNLTELVLESTLISTLDLSTYVSFNTLNASGCASLASITLTLLTQINSFDISNCIALSSVEFASGILFVGLLNADTDSLLVSVAIPNASFGDNQTINFRNCSLNQSSVDAILHRCLVSNLANSLIDVSGAFNSPPSAQGQSDAADLITAGCTVNFNP